MHRSSKRLKLSARAPKLPKQIRLENLNPIAIGVLDKGDVFHFSLIRAFDESDVVLVEPTDGGGQVQDGDAQMPESLGLTSW